MRRYEPSLAGSLLEARRLPSGLQPPAADAGQLPDVMTPGYTPPDAGPGSQVTIPGDFDRPSDGGLC